jgi:hypothetical protein
MYKPDKVDCCKDLECASGRRNNYFEGKRLTADSFRVEQRYLIERRQLLNRAIHGWGVVYGYAVTSADDGLKIGAGLALDECGRELLQAGEMTVAFKDLRLFDEHGERTEIHRVFSSDRSSRRVCWLLRAHYAEQSIGPFKVEDPCQCEHQEWEHICETVRYSLQSVSRDRCCRECECELKCECVCDEEGSSRCRCICKHLIDLKLPGGCEPMCDTEDPCGRLRVHYGHGVPIACVDVERDPCGGWKLGDKVDECGPRRLVKRNDLLFDLIQGCDLTRISEIGWKDWHRLKEAVPFDDFSKAFGPEGYRQHQYVTEKFWVEFSGPVREDTLRPDCFAMTVICGDREGGWWQVQRVPIVGLEYLSPSDPAGCVLGARIIVDGAWVEDGLRGRRSIFLDSETRVEIEIRGDFIVDCNGQTVDGNALGLSPGPTGNRNAGGTFISTFSVEGSRHADYDRPPDYDKERPADYGKRPDYGQAPDYGKGESS